MTFDHTLPAPGPRRTEAFAGAIVAVVATFGFGFLLLGGRISLPMLPYLVAATMLLAPVLGPLGWLLGSCTRRIAERYPAVVLATWAIACGAVAGISGVLAFYIVVAPVKMEWQTTMMAVGYSIFVSGLFSWFVGRRCRAERGVAS